MPNESPNQPEPLVSNLKNTAETLDGDSPEAVKDELQEQLREALDHVTGDTKEMITVALAELESGDSFNPQALAELVRETLREMGIKDTSVDASARAAAQNASQNPQPEATTREQPTPETPAAEEPDEPERDEDDYVEEMKAEEFLPPASEPKEPKDDTDVSSYEKVADLEQQDRLERVQKYVNHIRELLPPDRLNESRLNEAKILLNNMRQVVVDEPSREHKITLQKEVTPIEIAFEVAQKELQNTPPAATQTAAEPPQTETEPAEPEAAAAEEADPETTAAPATTPHVFDQLNSNTGEAFDLEEETSTERAQTAHTLISLIDTLIQDNNSAPPDMLAEGEDLRHAESALADLRKLAAAETDPAAKKKLEFRVNAHKDLIRQAQNKYEGWLREQQESETTPEAGDKQSTWNRAWSAVKGWFGKKAGDEVEVPAAAEAESPEDDPVGFKARFLAAAKSIALNKNEVDRQREAKDRELEANEKSLGLTEALQTNPELQAAHQQIEKARKDYVALSVFAKRETRRLQKERKKAKKERNKAVAKNGDVATLQARIASLEGQLGQATDRLQQAQRTYHEAINEAKDIERDLRSEAGQADSQIAYRLFERYTIKEGEASKAESRKHLAKALKPLAWYSTLSWGQKRLVNIAILTTVTTVSGGGLGILAGKAVYGAGLSLGVDAALKASGADVSKQIDQAGYQTLLESDHETEADLDAMLANLRDHFAQRSRTLKKWQNDKGNKGMRIATRSSALMIGLLSGIAASLPPDDATVEQLSESVTTTTDAADNLGTEPPIPQLDTSEVPPSPLAQEPAEPDTPTEAQPPAMGGEPDDGFVVDKDSLPASDQTLTNTPADPDSTDISGDSLRQSINQPANDPAASGDLDQPEAPESAANDNLDAGDSETGNPASSTPEVVGGGDVPLEAIVQKGDGISQIFERQLESNLELQDQVYKVLQGQGFAGNSGSPDMYKFLVENYGYMDASGNEIRLTADAIDTRAYTLEVVDDSIRVHEINLDTGSEPAIAEMHAYGDDFEGGNLEKGDEYLWPGNGARADAPGGGGSGEPVATSADAVADPDPETAANQDATGQTGGRNLEPDLPEADSNKTLDLTSDAQTGEGGLVLTDDAINSNSILSDYPTETQDLIQDIADKNDLELDEVATWYNQELQYQIEGPKSETNRELGRVLLGKNVTIDGERLDLVKPGPRSDLAAQSSYLFGTGDNPGQPIPRGFFNASAAEISSTIDESLPLGDMDRSAYQVNMLKNLHHAYGDEIRTILEENPNLSHMGELLAELKEARAESLVTEQLQDLATKNHATLPRVKELN